jgi:hypothetical protein
MIWQFTNTNKYGNLRSRVVYADGALKIGQGFGSFQGAKRFSYESRSPYFALIEIRGKKMLVPDWLEVHPQTTISDIKHNAPVVVEVPVQKSEWTFKSESSDSVYRVRQNGLKLTCTCLGSWRAFDRRCKHIKSIEKELGV